MKRTVLSIGAVLFIALAAVNVNIATKGAVLSKLKLSGISALGTTESTSGGYTAKERTCIESITICKTESGGMRCTITFGERIKCKKGTSDCTTTGCN